ncbi:hypothetical protein F0562_005232 [Nyssa sinensis]|uniref:Myb/SANT-like domain-containing protein n=1 Tax=Nyssa sinensis TaxID=561372 RepID=A0A5J5AHL7_9ASTE|nr:hypothetical protein F0562_005232 [Nyssa sinensis]
MSDCNIKSNPHIESKVKVLKKSYNTVTGTLGKSGFEWNDHLKCVNIDSDEVWETYLKKDPNAKSFKNKPFPMYEKLGFIFGKDQATGKEAEAPANAVEDLDASTNIVGLENIDTSTSVSQPLSANANSQQSHRKRNRATDTFASALKDLGSMFVQRIDVVAERIGQIVGHLDYVDLYFSSSDEDKEEFVVVLLEEGVE